MNVEKFLEKLEANNTSVTKEIAARLMRIMEKGFTKDRLSEHVNKKVSEETLN